MMWGRTAAKRFAPISCISALPRRSPPTQPTSRDGIVCRLQTATKAIVLSLGRVAVMRRHGMPSLRVGFVVISMGWLLL